MAELITQMIDFPSNEHTTPGYLARPDDEFAHPGVVVIQEWWGLVPHIKEVAERFARAGYVALAPDLYHGKTAEEPDEARKLVMELDIERALAEIRAAATHLQRMNVVSPKKVGVVGWCMGGRVALSIAVDPGNANIGAVVAFYGRPPEAEDVARIHVPVLGLFGELDKGIPVEVVQAFEEQLESRNVPHEITIYPEAHHGFFNDTRPHIYNAEAAEDAWRRTLDWFGGYLTG